MTATQERQPRPARRQVLRVDAQDGPWTVSVAENHHPSSYTLYIKSECPFTKDLSDIFVPFLRPVVVSHSSFILLCGHGLSRESCYSDLVRAQLYLHLPNSDFDGELC